MAARSREASGDVVRPTFLPPALPETEVSRSQLVQRLNAAVDKRMVLVVAPAGYGKSVLLAQWARSNPTRRIAWMTADVSDDANRFARDLCAAFEVTDGRDRSEIVSRIEAGGRRMGESFMAAFLESIDKISSVALVIDDFHAISNPDLLTEISLLVEKSPAQLHFVISSRVNPTFPYHWLRLSDQLVELRQRDLVFSTPDGHQLVEAIAGTPITAQQADLLLSRTEGWVTGLQLAALSMRHTEPQTFIESFVYEGSYIAEYLTEQVVDLQTEDVRRFLVESSVLDRLNASLCNAVMKIDDAQTMLDHLDSQSLFIVSLDDRRQTFRLHPLFRSLLRQRLHEVDNVNEQQLLERAADWYFAQDDIEQAVDCLIDAGLWEKVLENVQRFGYQLHSQRRTAAVVRWVDTLAEQPTINKGNDLVLLRSGVHLLAGDTIFADAMLQEMRTDQFLSRGESIAIDAINTWAVHARSKPTAVIAITDRLFEQLDSIDESEIPNVVGLTTPTLIRATGTLASGIAHMYVEQLDAAHEILQQVPQLNPGLAEIDVAAFGQLALLDAWRGRLRSARRHANRSLATAQQATCDARPATLAAHLALARVERLSDNVTEAAMHLDEAATRLSLTKPCALLGIYQTEQILLSLATGQHSAALALVAQVSTSVGPPPPPAVLTRLRVAEARLHFAMGNLDTSHSVINSHCQASLETVGLLVAIAVDKGDFQLARRVIDDSAGNDSLERRLWACIVDDMSSTTDTSLDAIAAVVAEAKEEGNVRVLFDANHHANRVLRRLYIEEPSPFLRKIIDAPVVNSMRVANDSSAKLVEPLSDRERMVLGYLPSRMSNSEIADALGISVNTLKTHLKHIYRKLDADGRRDAISCAEKLHLL